MTLPLEHIAVVSGERRRLLFAAAASIALHAVVALFAVRPPDWTRQPPAIDMPEAIPVELVIEAARGTAALPPIAPIEPAAPSLALRPASSAFALGPTPADTASFATPVAVAPPPMGPEAAGAPLAPAILGDSLIANRAGPRDPPLAPSAPDLPAALLSPPPPQAAAAAVAAIPTAVGPIATWPNASAPTAAWPSLAAATATSPSASTAVTEPVPPNKEGDTPRAQAAAPQMAAMLPAGSLEALRPADRHAMAADIVSRFDCARIGAAIDEATDAVVLSGHARSAVDKARLVDLLGALPGVSRVESTGLRIVGEPYCRVLALFDRPELSRSTAQRADLAAIGATTPPALRRLAGGQALELALTAPDFDAYLSVDYFSADGRVAHLLAGSPGDVVPAHSVFRLGPGGRGRSGIAGPPYGLDIVVVIAASAPILTAARPVVEDAGPYLELVARNIERLRTGDRSARFEYAYDLIVTSAPAGR